MGILAVQAIHYPRDFWNELSHLGWEGLIVIIGGAIIADTGQVGVGSGVRAGSVVNSFKFM